MLCSVSEHKPPEELRKFSFALLKTLINLINSSTSHFAKVTLHDFTDLHVKMGFYGGVKAHSSKGDGMGHDNRFISIIEFLLIAQPYFKVKKIIKMEQIY